MKDEKKELIVFKKESIFSKITNFIKSLFTKKELQMNSISENVTSSISNNVEEEKRSKTLEEKLEAVDKVPGLDETERLKRKIRILDAEDKKRKKQIMENIEVIKMSNTEYYKDIYDKVNSGVISIGDLTMEDFSKITKMQRIEYDLITNKLKDAMDNF